MRNEGKGIGKLRSLAGSVVLGVLLMHCSSSEPAASAAGTGGSVGSGGASQGGSGASAGRLASGGTSEGGRIDSMGGQGTGAFAEVESILQNNCATCHNGKGDSVDRVNLSNADGAVQLYLRLTSPISDTIAKCQGLLLVDAQTPTMSLLTQIIETDISTPGCMVPRMPLLCTDSDLPRACLSVSQIATIQDWINAGAPGP